jgi:hypothetical protein
MDRHRISRRRGHWIPAEGAALRSLLGDLLAVGVPPSDIRVLSPFRRVAEESAKIYEEIFPAAGRKDWGGTVHTMQGKEADVVVLVLGGDPRRPGARRFATESPNLLNVAVSRARRRLYVIGDRATWGGDGCFETLAAWVPPVAHATAAPSSASVSSASVSSASVERVWRTKLSQKYHRTPSCEALRAGQRRAERDGKQLSELEEVTLTIAQSEGHSGCQWCYPP